MGGGERWETDLIRQHGNETGTIGAALATEKRNASAGFDYKILEETIIFRVIGIKLHAWSFVHEIGHFKRLEDSVTAYF